MDNGFNDNGFSVTKEKRDRYSYFLAHGNNLLIEGTFRKRGVILAKANALLICNPRPKGRGN